MSRAHDSHLDIVKEGEYSARAKVTVTNIGTVSGAEVPQLYIHHVRPKVQKADVELVGFTKVHLEPGESETVSIPIDHKAFSYYDVSRKCWVADRGEYEFRVGPSSTLVSEARSFKLERSFRWIGQQDPRPL